jgi:hypothetical protein
MARALPQTPPLSKFQRYRMGKRHKGMRLLRVWVPDPRSEGFQKEVDRQVKLLRNKPEEKEALAFIEAAFDWHAE